MMMMMMMKCILQPKLLGSYSKVMQWASEKEDKNRLKLKFI